MFFPSKRSGQVNAMAFGRKWKEKLKCVSKPQRRTRAQATFQGDEPFSLLYLPASLPACRCSRESPIANLGTTQTRWTRDCIRDTAAGSPAFPETTGPQELFPDGVQDIQVSNGRTATSEEHAYADKRKKNENLDARWSLGSPFVVSFPGPC